jgi:uncharacterized membrane protein
MRIPPVERLLAMVGYAPFLWWLPIVAKRDSMFCQFHGRQSGVLWGMWLVPWGLFIVLVVVGVFSGAVRDFVATLTNPPVGPWFFGFLAAYTGLYLLMSLIGFLKAGFRERYRMPVVADVALKLRL